MAVPPPITMERFHPVDMILQDAGRAVTMSHMIPRPATVWKIAEPITFVALTWLLLNATESHVGRPASWIVGGVFLLVCVVVLYRRLRK
jgi:hypothetical protein